MNLKRTSLKKKGLFRRLKAGVLAWTFGILLTYTGEGTVQAAEEGTYLVTVVPSYKDPETGNIEDPGNNEAIGQGMTERMCGSTALLEVDSSGTMYLTVRYFLSQFIEDVTFEERYGGSFHELSYKETQTKEAVEGASDIADKYGYTDYRMKISSLDSVYRGKAFITAAGRNVVFFFTASTPVPGSGDFVTSTVTSSKVKEQGLPDGTTANKEEGWLPDDDINESTGNLSSEIEEGSSINGSGKADDPVTGIPKKPSSGSAVEKNAESQETGFYTYHLDTPYDLSQVNIDEARKLTKPMIKKAVGIVKITGQEFEKNSEVFAEEEKNSGNKKIMLVLLSISVILVACLGAGVLRRGKILKVAESQISQDGKEDGQEQGDRQ